MTEKVDFDWALEGHRETHGFGGWDHSKGTLPVSNCNEPKLPAFRAMSHCLKSAGQQCRAGKWQGDLRVHMCERSCMTLELCSHRSESCSVKWSLWERGEGTCISCRWNSTYIWNYMYLTQRKYRSKKVSLPPIDYPYASGSEVRVCVLVPSAEKHMY